MGAHGYHGDDGRGKSLACGLMAPLKLHSGVIKEIFGLHGRCLETSFLM
jgi:hypothetical protein